MIDFSVLWEWYLSVAVVSTVIFYINYKWNRRHFEALASKLPGPKALPIVGNIFYFIGISHDDFIIKIVELATKYSEHSLARFWFGPKLVVGVYKAEDLEAVLSGPKVIDKSVFFSFFQPRSKGAFTLSGEAWRKQRRIANRMFHANLMEGFIKVFNEQSKILVEHLGRKAKSGTFDVSHSLMRCTLDVICRTALGVNMHLQNDESITFPEDLSKSSEIILERTYKPWLYPTFIFKMTKLGKEMYRRIDNIHQFTMLVIQKRRKILNDLATKNKSNGVSKNGLNGHIHNEQDQAPIEYAPYIDSVLQYGKEENISDFQLALETLDVIIGGMDTSAIGDSYVLLMLGIHKEWQDKVHKEIDELFGNSDREITAADLGQLVNLDMVIKEVLRLYTAPHSIRLLTEDVKLEKFTLPASTVVYLSMFILHRDPDYYSHPDKFYPDHFLPENVSSRPKYSYLPFSSGPRGCPGSRYGMASMKTVLTYILRNFSVECDLKFDEMKYKPSLMLELIGGYPVRLIPRQPTCS